MKLYVSGSQQAFEILYHRYKGHVYTYVAKRIQGDHARSEIFQNIFLKFHKFKHKYDEQYELAKWIYTISRSELIDYCKKKKVELLPIELAPEPSTEADYQDQSSMKDLKHVSDKERQALHLRFEKDQEFDEIAEVMGLSSSNVRKIISRAFSKLRKKGVHYE